MDVHDVCHPLGLHAGGHDTSTALSTGEKRVGLEITAQLNTPLCCFSLLGQARA